jgi:hypothetical protein
MQMKMRPCILKMQYILEESPIQIQGFFINISFIMKFQNYTENNFRPAASDYNDRYFKKEKGNIL